MKYKLTNTFIKAISEPGEYRDTEVPGFILRATVGRQRTLNKTFIVKAKPKGSRRPVTCTIGREGAYDADGKQLNADNARRRAKVLVGQLAQGIDPNAHRRQSQAEQRLRDQLIQAEQEKRNLTLSKVLNDYLFHKKTLAEKTAHDYKSFIRRNLPEWLDKPIGEITRKMAMDKFEELRRRAPYQANYTFRILRALINYARRTYEDANGEPILSRNPVWALTDEDLWHETVPRRRHIHPKNMKAWFTAVMRLELIVPGKRPPPCTLPPLLPRSRLW